MRRLHVVCVAVALVLIISVSACSSAPSPAVPTTAPADAPTPPAAPTTESEPTSEPTVDFGAELEDFDPGNFDNPTNIDNEWLPMQPGMQYVYEGVTEESGLSIPHRVIISFSDLTKVIAGVRTVVAWDQDYSAGDLVETELAFFAQDNDGNVWRLGEYPEVYEEGTLAEVPAWIAGFKGARAGIIMEAQPQLGAPSYSQGWGPSVNFTDRGQVDQMGVQTCVPVDCYEDVLVIAEFTREEPDAFQLKYYARGVGNIQVGWRGADATRETLELIEITHLSPEALAEVRAQALELEERAYEISKEVYDQTPPSEIPPEAATGGEASEPEFVDFDSSNFDDRSTNIDNEWLPLQPGMHWVYEGTTTEADETFAHRIEFTITDLTKEIAGVRTVVAWVVDYSDGEVVEKEIAFYAQDDDGNVWYLGEYPEEYEDGEFVKAPTWIAGLEDARAGIKMWAAPQPGTPSYFQGWGPAVEWTDFGQVDQMAQETCVPVDCYEDVLVIAESSLDEQGAFQLKYYARGVGNVRVGWRGADATQEELELVEFTQLSPEALAEIRAEVLELEAHAYEISQDVYALTSPAE